jgi:hypothetical protein
MVSRLWEDCLHWLRPEAALWEGRWVTIGDWAVSIIWNGAAAKLPQHFLGRDRREGSHVRQKAEKRALSRRDFLKTASLGAAGIAAVTLVSSCKQEEATPTGEPVTEATDTPIPASPTPLEPVTITWWTEAADPTSSRPEGRPPTSSSTTPDTSSRWTTLRGDTAGMTSCTRGPSPTAPSRDTSSPCGLPRRP